MSGHMGLRRSRAVKLVVVTLVVLSVSLPLGPHAQQVTGQVVPAESRSLKLALDAEGRPWAVWETDDGGDTNIYYSRWDGSGWKRPRPLSTDPEAWEYMPSLALASDGTLWAAWSRSTGPTQGSVLVSHWGSRGWSEPMQVPGTADLAGERPALAPTPEGGLWLAWVGHDGTDKEIFASRWDGSTWSVPQRVGSDDTDPLAYDTQPTVAVDSNGSAWLAWTSYEGPLSDEIHASHWDGVAWSPQQKVSTGDETPDSWPAMSFDAQGQPWIAWQGVTAEDGHRWRIYASLWDAADAAWSAEALVSSPPSLDVEEQRPSLALDSMGRLHLTWAISGRLSGIAHTTWDGTTWASPAWTSTDEAVEAPTVLADGEPWLLWLAQAGLETAPVQGQRVQDMTEPLPQVLPSPPEISVPLSATVPNRHLAHGDSITEGGYPDRNGQPTVPYPTTLEEILDSKVTQSEVINWGQASERAARPETEERIRAGVQTYTPQFVQILEGTNDLKDGTSPAVTEFAVRKLVWNARDRSGVPGVLVMVGTLTPRLDHVNDDVYETNQIILREIPRKAKAPVADLWQAYDDYGPWKELYVDYVHPGTAGMRIIAETFYQAMLNEGWLAGDYTPPSARITSVGSECKRVAVTWTGDDGGGSGVASFDVQVQDNWGPWTDWLVETTGASGTYSYAQYGHTLGFRVRARDQVGNLGAWSLPATTQVTDSIPPENVVVAPLPAAQKAPFTVHWSGTDRCDPQLTYDVRYCVGETCSATAGSWQTWQTSTTSTSAAFDPASPQYGKRYSFRARAYDEAGNGSDSTPVSTLLARFTLGGDVLTVRDRPVVWATVSAPGALAVVQFVGGGYLAYVAGPGTYELSASRQGFGSLPPLHAELLASDLSGLDFVLPPEDDIVGNGGFESGLASWQPGGTPSPAPISEAHTGSGAVRLGGGTGTSSLRQSLTVPDTLTDPTLSFLVRLDSTGGKSTLGVELSGMPKKSIEVLTTDWTHVWFPVDAATGRTATLTFTVSGNPAVRLDEVSLGSALSGGSWTFVPIISRGGTP